MLDHTGADVHRHGGRVRLGQRQGVDVSARRRPDEAQVEYRLHRLVQQQCQEWHGDHHVHRYRQLHWHEDRHLRDRSGKSSSEQHVDNHAEHHGSDLHGMPDYAEQLQGVLPEQVSSDSGIRNGLHHHIRREHKCRHECRNRHVHW